MSAVFSEDKVYRYALWRDFLLGEGQLLFVMLNPSTADEIKNDPTVTRCIGFAESWGYRSLAVANIFAYRSTDPKKLGLTQDPVGPENDEWIQRLAGESDRIVLAWGADVAARTRGLDVVRLLSDYDLYSLGRTQNGHPLHPLYLKSETKAQLFMQAREISSRAPVAETCGPLALIGPGWELLGVEEHRHGQWAARVKAPDGREEVRSALTAVAAVDAAIGALDPTQLPNRAELGRAVLELGERVASRA